MRPAPSEPAGLARLGRLVAFVFSAAFLGACLAIAGYDGKTAGTGTTDDGTTDELPPDGAMPPADGTGVPVVVPDGGVSDAAVFALKNCEGLDASCPADQPHCSIYFDAGVGQHVYSCVSTEEQNAAPGYDVRCGTPPRECGESLACGYSWSTGFHCTNVCKTNADCRGTRPFCNHPLTLPTLGPLSLCETCDPTRTNECTGTNAGCLVRSAATDPACGTVGADAGPLDAVCNKAADCKSGLVCVCNNGTGVGDDCSAIPGVCLQPCFQRGTACAPVGGQAARTCTAVTNTLGLYSYCKP